MILETPAKGGSGQAGIFASCLARLRRWLDNVTGAAWPFPRPDLAGMALAGTAAAIRRAITQRLRRATLLFLHEDDDRRRTAMALMSQEFDVGLSSSQGSSSIVLLLTPQCQADLTGDPGWYRDRIEGMRARHPDLGVITFTEAGQLGSCQSIGALLEAIDISIAREVKQHAEDPAPEPDPFS